MKRIGLDLVDISRFKKFEGKPGHHFIKKVFSVREISYCFGYKEAAPHLAGTFAAKEAASKALGTVKFPSLGLEIRHQKIGCPTVWKGKKKIHNIDISITHTDTLAAAVAIA